MERRKALTIAGVATAILATGSIAMAANVGLLGLAGAEPSDVGNLDARNVADLVAITETDPAANLEAEVVVVEEFIDEPIYVEGAPATVIPGGSGIDATGSTAPDFVPPSVTSTSGDQGSDDDGSGGGYEDHDEDDEDEEYEEDEDDEDEEHDGDDDDD